MAVKNIKPTSKKQSAISSKDYAKLAMSKRPDVEVVKNAFRYAANNGMLAGITTNVKDICNPHENYNAVVKIPCQVTPVNTPENKELPDAEKRYNYRLTVELYDDGEKIGMRAINLNQFYDKNEELISDTEEIVNAIELFYSMEVGDELTVRTGEMTDFQGGYMSAKAMLTE